MTETSGYSGNMTPNSSVGEYNAMAFVVAQILGRVNTSTLVKIVKCTNDGGLSSVGYVDVIPLVNQVDGQGNPVPHDVVYGLPYMRIQGGLNAIIIDPEVDDIGIAIFASRDISKVKSTKGTAMPGSNRRFDMADGLYIGGVLNAVPHQYVQFQASGITIVSPNKITVTAPVVDVHSSTSVDITSPTTTIHGALIVTGSITGQSGENITGDVAVTGKINATLAIESAAALKVAGVTLNVP